MRSAAPISSQGSTLNGCGAQTPNAMPLARIHLALRARHSFHSLLTCRATAAPPVLIQQSSSPSAPSAGAVQGLKGVSSQAPPSGRIELILGPMFAGKSSQLLKQARQEERAGRHVLLVKSAKDTRYRVGSVTTHDGDHMPCITTELLSTLLTDVEWAAQIKFAQVIAIDEAQFFTDLQEFVETAADQHGKHFIIAGLDGDFKRQRFGQLLDLIPHADQVTKLTACCQEPGCKNPAIFSKRITSDQRQEIVGGADIYQASCRKHYLQAPAAPKAALRPPVVSESVR